MKTLPVIIALLIAFGVGFFSGVRVNPEKHTTYKVTQESNGKVKVLGTVTGPKE